MGEILNGIPRTGCCNYDDGEPAEVTGLEHHGTLAAAHLDDDFHLRGDFYPLPAPELAGVRLGAGLVYRAVKFERR
jgi:hypothetical protein